ncbi:restriction endonuclease [[Phormidium ambiguum] IAM M-71]|uniref:site-specific DNA-methyltransferase (adenine-specific) n=1 Tax=[Phormidium ambiguum] IAM M-71 TaxID=454136 RepID=A0A1U7I9M6_9CYAN|nr:DNA methyltransferase [Phormidium ambiguum]OKH33170.1 restriction endonuclease [Phormidium ambiguum IAM M-71]
MSTARHHAEWLSLVEASGPFLSLPVLLKVFPSGLDAHDSEHLKLLRLAYQEWQDNQLGARPEKAIHRAWVEFVLRQTLELPDEVFLEGQRIPPGLQVTVAEQGELLRPDWVIVNPQGTANAGTPRLLVQIVPSEQDLEKALAGQRWKASPATRMMELLHAANVRLGLVTNGEHWMLVNAPRGETTGFISWYATLWLEEHLTLRAFRSLLGVRRFFGVDDSETLETLLTQSITDQQEVTDQLGYQVRRAVEVLVQALDRIDQDRNRTLLENISETQLYEAALTVMMRLVFLFAAEERKLIPSPGGETLYNEYYAVSTIAAKLRSDADKFGEEVLERRSDAWCRLLATFRAVFGGIRHDLLDLPAYGGSLFDPDRFPFLEGRALGSQWNDAKPIPVNNRIVLHLLEALQILQIRVGGTLEPRRLSFRALDIEQIGHVYEGLLDHTAVRASSPVLGLIGTREREPEVALAELERLQGLGEEDLVKFVKEQSNKSPAALKKALSAEILPRMQERLRIACNNDEDLYRRVLPFAGLIRLDTLEYPVVIPTGSVYVTQGSNRRETGTHYTPRSLTEPIVQYTLEPLVYQGVAEGKPKSEWRLKSAKDLLLLKICDMAMGSGAFLVQTCRYLAERLVEAWETAERENPGKVVIAPEGTLSQFRPDECPIPKDSDERLTVARRIVAERCLYGVDKNPLAVEMAKLSLWLITLAQGRPFTFLNHALKWGDSLLGVTDAQQIEFFHLNPKQGNQLSIISMVCRPLLEEAIAKRQELEGFSVNDIRDLQRKDELLKEAEKALNQVRFIGDLLVGEALMQAGKTGNLVVEDLAVLSQQVAGVLAVKGEERQRQIEVLYAKAQRMLDIGKPGGQAPRKTFHWALEFPEVFLSDLSGKGFDALIGNPPFLAEWKITGTLGTDYRDFLVEHIANRKGRADLCAYFFLRGAQLVSKKGSIGLIATNTISQGDTREVGLDQLVGNGFIIRRAVSSCKWPGNASLEVAYVWLHSGNWHNEFILDEKLVSGITPLLTVMGRAVGNPYRLRDNQGKSFKGYELYGMGFVITPEEAQNLIAKNPCNKDVLFPFLNGEDLNSSPNQSPSRWAINFFDWPLDAGNDDPKKPKGKPYAKDYPDCLDIVEEKVKPERAAKSADVAAIPWWRYWRIRQELRNAIADMKRVIVIPLVSKHFICVWGSTDIVYSHALGIIATESNADFSLIQSTFHEEWARTRGSTLETRMRYTPSDCFETFPFPTSTSNLEEIGEKYYTHRQSIMQTRQEGLTKTYNRFHNPEETAPDIEQLRSLHIEMDNAVAAAYGWQDIDLGHDFHETKQGLRFTISETARREVLDRLLLLNHERYAEEVAQGLHDKGKKKGKTNKKAAKKEVSSDGQLSLF